MSESGKAQDMRESKPPIFIVDDDEAVCKALRRLITSAGYCVQTFASGQEFLDSVPADAEGFLILDVFMPRMSGFQMYDKLLAMGSKLKVIFITAQPQNDDRERAMSRGTVAFLEKPFNDQELIDLLKTE
jgi:two-component system response regulator FixJ